MNRILELRREHEVVHEEQRPGYRKVVVSLMFSSRSGVVTRRQGFQRSSNNAHHRSGARFTETTALFLFSRLEIPKLGRRRAHLPSFNVGLNNSSNSSSRSDSRSNRGRRFSLPANVMALPTSRRLSVASPFTPCGFEPSSAGVTNKPMEFLVS